MKLIVAYVSGLNACDYCFGVHRTTAQAFGVQEGLLTSLLAGVETADVDERIRQLLWYVGKVTREPARVSAADARRVLDAGWDEQALHDAVSVCALFNFMNRFVSGLGVSAREDYGAHDLSGGDGSSAQSVGRRGARWTLWQRRTGQLMTSVAGRQATNCSLTAVDSMFERIDAGDIELIGMVGCPMSLFKAAIGGLHAELTDDLGYEKGSPEAPLSRTPATVALQKRRHPSSPRSIWTSRVTARQLTRLVQQF